MTLPKEIKLCIPNAEILPKNTSDTEQKNERPKDVRNSPKKKNNNKKPQKNNTVESTSLNTAVFTKRDQLLGLMLLRFVFSGNFDLIRTAFKILKLPSKSYFEF